MKSFNTADRPTVAALHRMNSPDMKPLLMFLMAQFEESKDALVHAEDPMVKRLQGRAGYLADFLTAVSNAAVSLERFEKNRSQPG